MKKTANKKGNKALKILLVLFLVLILAAAGLFFGSRYIMSKAPDVQQTTKDFLNAVCKGDWQAAEEIMPGFEAPEAGTAPESSAGQALYQVMTGSLGYSLEGEGWRNRLDAGQDVIISGLDMEKLEQGMNQEINQALEAMVNEAQRASDIYDEDNNFKPQVVEQAFNQVLNARLEALTPYLSQSNLSLELRYSRGKWHLQNADALTSVLTAFARQAQADTLAQELFGRTTQELTYVSMRYTISEDALSGPVPNQENFGSTEDPAVIEALLETESAKRLIGEQELAWNSQIERIPGTSIRYYLDETMLAIVWQEEEARGVGTFAELILADASQLRRRIAGDEFESYDFKTTSQFAADTNAVLAVGGDFYHHGRSCGIVVYDRQIYRYDLDSCDTCYITGSGDMIFSYRGQFASAEEADSFVQDNDVLFSLCFGPVLIDEGADVTPESYPWGEVNDEYARSALGMLGERHYLTMNINCQMPGYYYLATLRQATDAMLEKGCIKAYALDGGQTATTVFNGELINPVQFGWEKPISDVIYFASAMPE